MAVEVADTKVPSIARWLGGLGAVPFIVLAGAMPLLADTARILTANGLLAYGAVILSFLGGVHWGLAIQSQRSSDQGELKSRLTLSVIPSLVGWVALLVGQPTGLLILAIAIAAMCMVDIRASKFGQAPRWYSRLRIPLTAVVVATLIFSVIALMIGIGETRTSQIELFSTALAADGASMRVTLATG